MALRVNGTMLVLPMSAAIVTNPTALVVVMTVTLIPTRAVAGEPIQHWTARRPHRQAHDRCGLNDNRRAEHRRWRTGRCGHHDGRIPDWNGQSERDVHRPTRLGGSGKPDNSNCDNQTEL